MQQRDFNRLKSSFRQGSNDFEQAATKVSSTQANKLQDLVARNIKTKFGKNHNFSRLNSVQDFQEQVPLSEYNYFEPYIEEIKKGKRNMLTTEEVTCFVPTSGTTKGSKLIPYTQSLFLEFQQGLSPWIFNLCETYPEIGEGAWYFSSSPTAKKKETKGNTPIGLQSDLAYFSSEQIRALSEYLVAPTTQPNSTSLEDYLNQTRDLLISQKDLAFISTWSPTMIQMLFEDEKKELNPALISCWGDGSSKSFFNAAKKIFPETPFQKKGVLATEGLYTFPMAGIEGHALSINSHFFEFIDSQNVVHLAHELDKNQTYELVISTSGGLYRYKTGDKFEVRDFYKDVPTFTFLGRDQISDLVGEKLSEDDILRTKEETGIDALILAPDSSKQFYNIFTDEQISPERKTRTLQILKKNPYIKEAIEMNQLQQFAWFHTNGKPLHQTYTEKKVADGSKLGDIKPPVLVDETMGSYLLLKTTSF
jgi:hypothetical protein